LPTTKTFPTPGPTLTSIGLATVLVTLGLLAGPWALEAQDGEATVRDGVYTEEQAAQGSRVFEAECAFCHAPAEFSGRIFQITWQGRSVGALFTQVKTTMPLDRPGSLTDEQYAAVVAYILRLNQYPAGDHALAPDPESLNLIRIEPVPGSRR
jgi:mono/diheme cytochrome c family protein